MACAINTDDASGLNAERLALVQKLLIQGKEFVEQVYIPDLLTIASFYKDWGAIGGFTILWHLEISLWLVTETKI
jgi:hydrogenase large subunit